MVCAAPSAHPLHAGGSRQVPHLGPPERSWPSALILSLPIGLAVLLLLAGLHAWATLRQPLRGLSAIQLSPAGDTAPEAAPYPTDSTILAPGFTPQVERWAAHIRVWSQQSGLPANLIATVMQVESCGDPQAESPSGALGLFQVMPFHFKPGDDPLDPETNASRGLEYLAEGLRQAQGRVDLALAGYNGGHGQIARPPEAWPDETRRYVRWTTSILADVEAASTDSPGLQAWLAAGGKRLCAQASLRAGPAVANVAPWRN